MAGSQAHYKKQLALVTTDRQRASDKGRSIAKQMVRHMLTP